MTRKLHLDIYYVALTLRDIFCSPTASWYESWPPFASDITGGGVKKQVSPLLFNFVTWFLGFSNELEDVEYVGVEECCSEGFFHLPRLGVRL